MKIQSYLPIFPGFYGTFFEPDFENSEFDYDEYCQRVSIACCSFVQKELEDFGIKVQFQSVQRPRQYNYVNDSINVEYDIKYLKQMRQYILSDFRSEFEEYLRQNYSAYDGFAPLHSIEVNDWVMNITDSHKFGAVLDFIIINELTGYEGSSGTEEAKAVDEMLHAVREEMYL